MISLKRYRKKSETGTESLIFEIFHERSKTGEAGFWKELGADGSPAWRLGIEIAPAWKHRGIASAAMPGIIAGMKKEAGRGATLLASTSNPACRRVLEKNGFGTPEEETWGIFGEQGAEAFETLALRI